MSDGDGQFKLDRLMEWERAEMRRSAREARHTSDQELRDSENDIARYISPPAATAYPLEYLFSRVGDVSGRTVLDLGCGSGQNTLYLARRGANVVATDISAELIQVAVRRLQICGVAGVRFVVSSAHQLPLRDDSIDLVFGNAVLHHLELTHASQEIFRVLRRGGRALFQEPVRDSRIYGALRKLLPIRHDDLSPYERPLTTRELRMFGAPSRRWTSRAFELPLVRLGHALPVVRRHLAPLYRLDALLLRTVPALDRLAAIRVFELLK